jgi:hypothetical protein
MTVQDVVVTTKIRIGIVYNIYKKYAKHKEVYKVYKLKVWPLQNKLTARPLLLKSLLRCVANKFRISN